MYYEETLPIEVNESLTQSALQEGVQRKIPITQTLVHVQKRLETLGNTVSFPIQEEKNYIESRRSLVSLQKEMQWTILAYQKEPLSASDFIFLKELSKRETTIETLLNKTAKSFTSSYTTPPATTKKILTSAILAMQTSSSAILEDHLACYPKISLEKKKKMQEHLAQFTENYLKKVDPLIQFLSTHWAEWHTVRLQKGRALLIKETFDSQLSILISPFGECFFLFANKGSLLGVGTHKMVLRALSLPNGKISAIVRGSLFNTPSQEDGANEPAWFRHMWKEYHTLEPIKSKRGVIDVQAALPFYTPLGKELFLVEAYYWDGSLDSYFLRTLHNPDCPPSAKFSMKEIEKIMEDLLEGLVAIHETGIIHNDIKPDNILFSKRDKTLSAVFADFHQAFFPSSTLTSFPLARATWAPPEYAKMILSIPQRAKAAQILSYGIDVWGLGLIFSILVFNQSLPWLVDFRMPDLQEVPLPGKMSNTLIAEIDRPIFQKIVDLPQEWLPKTAENNPYFPLIQGMLAKDPRKRCTAKQALALFHNCKSKA